jgi:hypothetical protein
MRGGECGERATQHDGIQHISVMGEIPRDLFRAARLMATPGTEVTEIGVVGAASAVST